VVLRNADKSTVRPVIPCSVRQFGKGAKYAGSVGHSITTMLSAFMGLRPPYLLTRGSAPGPRWGLCPQTPVIGSCFALAMVPPNLSPLSPPMILAPRAPSYFDKFTPVKLTVLASVDLRSTTYATLSHRASKSLNSALCVNCTSRRSICSS